MDQEEDIFPVDFIEVGTFIPQRAARRVPENDPVDAARLRTGNVLLQLCQADIPVAVDDIDPPVVIKEQGRIVINSINILLCPGALDVFRREKKGLRPLVGDEDDIKPAGAVPERSGPHAVAVGRLFPLQRFARGMLQRFVEIGADLPADQVVGPEDDGAGEKVHGGADHVVCVSDADDVRIRIVHPGQGIEAFCHCDRLRLAVPVLWDHNASFSVHCQWERVLRDYPAAGGSKADSPRK